MRYGRDESCARASPSEASSTTSAISARKVRIMASVCGCGFPIGAARGDRESHAAEEHERGERDEGPLITPQDYQQARDEGSQRVAETLEEPVDAVDGVVAVDANLLLAVLGHERALRGDRQRLPQAQEEHHAKKHEEAVGEQQQEAAHPRDDEADGD